MAGMSVWQLTIIALIILMLFGSKKLRNIGTDVGGAIKGFKNSMKDDPSAIKNNESSD